MVFYQMIGMQCVKKWKVVILYCTAILQITIQNQVDVNEKLQWCGGRYRGCAFNCVGFTFKWNSPGIMGFTEHAVLIYEDK